MCIQHGSQTRISGAECSRALFFMTRVVDNLTPTLLVVIYLEEAALGVSFSIIMQRGHRVIKHQTERMKRVATIRSMHYPNLTPDGHEKRWSRGLSLEQRACRLASLEDHAAVLLEISYS